MDEENDNKMLALANSAALILISRLSAPLMVSVCAWILISVIGMKTDLASLSASFNEVKASYNERITSLESWRNNMLDRND